MMMFSSQQVDGTRELFQRHHYNLNLGANALQLPRRVLGPCPLVPQSKFFAALHLFAWRIDWQ